MFKAWSITGHAFSYNVKREEEVMKYMNKKTVGWFTLLACIAAKIVNAVWGLCLATYILLAIVTIGLGAACVVGSFVCDMIDDIFS